MTTDIILKGWTLQLAQLEEDVCLNRRRGWAVQVVLYMNQDGQLEPVKVTSKQPDKKHVAKEQRIT